MRRQSRQPTRDSVRDPQREPPHELLRIGDDETFAKQLFTMLRNDGAVYWPRDTTAYEEHCDRLFDQWWRNAEKESPLLVEQTRWLRTLAKKHYREGDVKKYMRQTKGANLEVQKLVEGYEGYDPDCELQVTFPAMMVKIDKETGRGLVALLPILRGTIVGQFTGTVTHKCGTHKHQLSHLQRRYIMEMTYAGSDYVINPVIAEARGKKPTVEAGALLNEPRSYKLGLHGRQKGKLPGDWYAIRDQRGGVLDYEYYINGMRWVTPETGTTAEPHANVIKIRERGSEHARKKTFTIPLADVDIPDHTRDKMVGNVSCVPIELPLCFYDKAQEKGARAIYVFNRSKFHGDLCVKLEEAYNMTRMIVRPPFEGPSGQRTVKRGYEEFEEFGKRDIRPYSILFLKDDVFKCCRRPVIVLPIDARYATQARDFDHLLWWSNDMNHVRELKKRCARAREISDGAPEARSVDDAIARVEREYGQEKNVDVSKIKSNFAQYESEATDQEWRAEIVLLRFFRKVDSWNCIKDQICAKLPDGRHVPYPSYRTGIRTVSPGDELLFEYDPERGSTKRGLHATWPVDVPDVLQGPQWYDTATRRGS